MIATPVRGIEYLAGKLNIDDLITRRRTLFNQEKEIADLTQMVGFNVAELCAATGKFFELLDDHPSERANQDQPTQNHDGRWDPIG